jgi:hypothetical protein
MNGVQHIVVPRITCRPRQDDFPGARALSVIFDGRQQRAPRRNASLTAARRPEDGLPSVRRRDLATSRWIRATLWVQGFAAGWEAGGPILERPAAAGKRRRGDFAAKGLRAGRRVHGTVCAASLVLSVSRQALILYPP